MYIPGKCFFRSLIKEEDDVPEIQFILFELEGFWRVAIVIAGQRARNDIHRHMSKFSLNMENKISQSPFCSFSKERAPTGPEIGGPLWCSL